MDPTGKITTAAGRRERRGRTTSVLICGCDEYGTTAGLLGLDGAYLQVGEDETAFGGRRAKSCYMVTVAAMCPGPEQLSAERAWVRSFWDALRPAVGR